MFVKLPFSKSVTKPVGIGPLPVTFTVAVSEPSAATVEELNVTTVVVLASVFA